MVTHMDNIDLYLPLEWLLVGSWWFVLLKCWITCPVGPTLLGLIFESRWVPWSPKYQFLAFVPGNFFLGTFIALSTTTFDALPSSGLYNHPLAHVFALLGTGGLYIALNYLDFGAYSKAQLLGATKIYHNSLYFWYGYVAVMCLLAVLAADVSAFAKLGVMLPGLVWIACLVIDARTSPEKLEPKFKFAHADNVPIWKTRGRLRKRTEAGYELVP